MTVWIDKLSNCLELGIVDLDLLKDVDDILSWMVSSNNDPLYKSLEESYGQQGLSERFEEFLDRLIVGDLAAGDMFPVSLDEEHAKKRYRKLIRIFHPDRGVKPDVWLNYRAEKINKAHQKYLADMSNFSSFASIDEPAVEVEVERKVSVSSKTKFKYRPNVWRERLGDPKEFQRKALAFLIITSSLLVLIVFLGDRQSYESVSTPVNTQKSLKQDSVVESDRHSVEVYVLSPQAQGILREADRLIAESEVSSLDGSLDQVDSLTGLLNDDGQEHNISLGEVEPHAVENLDVCHGGFAQDIEEDVLEKQLLVRLNMRAGPSIECEVLKTLLPGASLLLYAKTKDEKWTQVVIGDEGIQGWVDTQLLMAPSDKATEKVVGSKVSSFNQSLVQKNKVLPVEDDKPSAAVVAPKVSSELETAGTIEEPWIAPAYFKSVEKLKSYYELGDGDAMAGLYMSSGRENEIRGADKIRKYYRRAFSKTENRKFKYSIDSYEQDSYSTAVVKGKMYLSLTPKKSSKITNINANYKIVMVKVGGDYKIAAFEWQAM